MTKSPTKPIQYNPNDEPVVFSKVTCDILLKCPKPNDCIALYFFYYYTAKWQKTNQPMATTGYVQKGLKWGEQKVRSTKKQLKEVGLVEDITQIDPVSKKVIGWYIKVNFIWGNEAVEKYTRKTTPLKTTRVEKTTPLENHPVVYKGPNASSTNNINASSTGTLRDEDEEKEKHIVLHGKIKPSHFEKVYNTYPKKAQYGNAEKAFLKLCSKKVQSRPTFKEIIKAIKSQSKTKQWGNKKYIPLFSTWCNQSRWKDEIDPMNEVWDSPNNNNNNNNKSKIHNGAPCEMDLSNVEIFQNQN